MVMEAAERTEMAALKLASARERRRNIDAALKILRTVASRCARRGRLISSEEGEECGVVKTEAAERGTRRSASSHLNK